jgi:hypothetical protein
MARIPPILVSSEPCLLCALSPPLDSGDCCSAMPSPPPSRSIAESPGYDGATRIYEPTNDVTVILNPNGCVKTVYPGGG